MRRFFFFFLGIACLLQSCLKDDLSFPREDSNINVSSVSIITLLNRIDTDQFSLDGSNACFEFIYPITLNFNTGSSITVDNDEGLLELAKNQSSGLHVVGFNFPLDLVNNGNPNNITDDASLLELLLACDLGSFRSDFEHFFASCFEVKFPITLIAEGDTEVSFESLNDFLSFDSFEDTLFQPDFKFPVTVSSSQLDREVKIRDYYDFYRLFEQCGTCPSLSFQKEELGDGLNFKFTADFEGKDIFSYEWVISQNGEEIFKEVEGRDGDDQLTYQFEPGSYEVCLRAEGASEDCPGELLTCKEITAAS